MIGKQGLNLGSRWGSEHPFRSNQGTGRTTEYKSPSLGQGRPCPPALGAESDVAGKVWGVVGGGGAPLSRQALQGKPQTDPVALGNAFSQFFVVVDWGS